MSSQLERSGHDNETRSDSLYSSVVSLEHVLDDRVGRSEQVRLTRARSLHLLLHRHRLMGCVLLSKTRDVPHSDREIHRRRDDEVLLRVELSAPVGRKQGPVSSRDMCRSSKKRRAYMM